MTKLPWQVQEPLLGHAAGGAPQTASTRKGRPELPAPELQQIPVMPSHPHLTCSNSVSHYFRASLQRQHVLNPSLPPSCKAVTIECMNDSVFLRAVLLKSAFWRRVRVEPDKYYKRTLEVSHATR